MSDTGRMTDAIRRGDLEAVATLIRSGADVNAVDDPHWPPLHQAIEHQRVEIVRRLIAAGVAVNRDVGQGWTPLAHAIDIESDAASQAGLSPDDISTELVELLLAAGAVPTKRAFELVAAYNSHKALSLLLRARDTAPGTCAPINEVTDSS